mgnify:CR=1 FL=1
MDWNTLIPAAFGWLKSDPTVVISVALAWGYWRKDQQLAASQEARIEITKGAVEVVERQTATQEKLANVVASLTDEIRRGS